jgi:hypothetical protein
MHTKHYFTAILIIALTLLAGFSGKAQNSSDTVTIVEKWYGADYYVKNVPLKLSNLLYLAKDNKEAYRLIHKAQNLQATAYCLSIVGGCAIGGSLGYVLTCFLFDNKVETIKLASVLTAGIVVMIGGIAFDGAANQNIRKGIKLFNSSRKQDVSTNLDLGLSPTGMMLRLSF